eukprot:1161053-Pelagomonas_calceolata.AAC.14
MCIPPWELKFKCKLIPPIGAMKSSTHACARGIMQELSCRWGNLTWPPDSEEVHQWTATCQKWGSKTKSHSENPWVNCCPFNHVNSKWNHNQMVAETTCMSE